MLGCLCSYAMFVQLSVQLNGNPDTSAKNNTNAERGNCRKEMDGQIIHLRQGERPIRHLDGAIYRRNGSRPAGVDEDH